MQPADPPPPPAPVTVLVAEDDRLVRELICRALRGCGYLVLEAENGPRAEELSREHAGDIHLLITDVVMPLMSGPSLAARVSRARPGTKVLFLSGHSDSMVGRFADPAVPLFLHKPFTLAELRGKVREVLGAAE